MPTSLAYTGWTRSGAAYHEKCIYQRRALTSVRLRSLKSLKRLSLQSNRLSSMEGLEGCACLEELYLSHNGITRLQVWALQVFVQMRAALHSNATFW